MLPWLYKVEGEINCLGASFGIVTVQAEYNILYYLFKFEYQVLPFFCFQGKKN